jgi:hypothetical protein
MSVQSGQCVLTMKIMRSGNVNDVNGVAGKQLVITIESIGDGVFLSEIAGAFST